MTAGAGRQAVGHVARWVLAAKWFWELWVLGGL